MKNLKIKNFIFILMIIIISSLSYSASTDDNDKDYIKNDKNITLIKQDEKTDKFIKDTNESNEVTNENIDSQLVNNNKKNSNEYNKTSNERDTEINDENKKIIDNHVDNITSTPVKNIFYDTSKTALASVPFAIQSLRTYIYIHIINSVDRITLIIGARLSTYMALICVAFATLQIAWNVLMYKLDLSKQDEKVNISGYLSQQAPYLIKVAIITMLLATNFYWYAYATIMKNIFIMLGGTFAGDYSVNYTSIAFKMVTLMWMPIKLIMSGLLSIFRITPIFTGEFLMLVLFGLLLLFLVGKAIAEYVLIIIEYMIVGVFSIIILPFGLLKVTDKFSGKLIGGMLSAGINVTVATTLMVFTFKLSDSVSISSWGITYNSTSTYMTVLLIYILTVLMTKAKTIGNFVVRGQGVQVKGSEIVNEGIMNTISVVSTAVSIGTLISGVGAAITAFKAAAALATEAAKEAGKKAAEVAAKKAMEEGAKKVATEGVREAATKEALKTGMDKAKTELLKSMKNTAMKASSRRFRTQAVGSQLARMQQSESVNLNQMVSLGMNLASLAATKNMNTDAIQEKTKEDVAENMNNSDNVNQTEPKNE